MCIANVNQKQEKGKKQDKKEKKKNLITSPAGNRTPVSRVTGGDTHHYTTEDRTRKVRKPLLFKGKMPS